MGAMVVRSSRREVAASNLGGVRAIGKRGEDERRWELKLPLNESCEVVHLALVRMGHGGRWCREELWDELGGIEEYGYDVPKMR